MIAWWIAVVAVGELRGADLNFAHGLYRDHRYKLAAEEYQAFLRDGPSGKPAAEARYFLAESLLQLNRVAEAAPLFEALAKEGRPERDYYKQSLFRLGILQAGRNESAGGETLLHRFIAEFPGDPEAATALSSLAECQFALGKIDAATATLAEAQAKVGAAGPQRPRMLLLEGRLAEKAGRLDAAARLFREAAETDSSWSPDAQFALGALEFNRRRYSEAEHAFTGLTQKSPRHAMASTAALYSALCRGEMGDAPTAIRELELLVARTPQDNDADETKVVQSEAFYQLVRWRSKQREWAGAEQAARQGLERFPTGPRSADLKFFAAVTPLDAGRKAEGIAALKSFVSGADGGPLLENAFGRLCLAATESGAKADAAQAYQSLVRDYPAGAWRSKAALAMSSAGFWKTTEELDRAAAAAPDAPIRYELQYQKGALLYELKAYAEAAAALSALAAETAPADVRANASYLSGLAAYHLGNWDDALLHLESYLKRPGPRDDAALRTAASTWGRSLAKLDAKRIPERIDRLAASLAPKQPPLLLAEAAGALLDEKQIVEAEHCFQRSGLGDADSPLQLKWGRCLLELKRPRDALRKLEHGVVAADSTQSPAACEQAYLQGVAYMQTADAAAARKAFERSLHAGPATTLGQDAGLRLARLHADAGEWSAVENLFRTLNGSAPNEAKAKLGLEQGLLLAGSKDHQLEAAALLKAAAAQQSGDDALAALLKLAELQQERGDLVAAESTLAQAADRRSAGDQLPELLYRKATIAFQQKKWTEAAQTLSLMVARFPNDPIAPSAQLLLAEIEFENERSASALEKYTKLAQRSDLGALRPTVELRLCQCRLLLKQWPAAASAAEQFLASKPPADLAADAVYVHARASEQLGKFDEARVEYQKVLTVGAPLLKSKAQFMLGESWLHQRQYAKALKEYLKVALLSEFPEWQSTGLLQAGKCHELLNETQSAVETFGQVVDRFPQSAAAEQAKTRLAALQRSRTESR